MLPLKCTARTSESELETALGVAALMRPTLRSMRARCALMLSASGGRPCPRGHVHASRRWAEMASQTASPASGAHALGGESRHARSTLLGPWLRQLAWWTSRQLSPAALKRLVRQPEAVGPPRSNSVRHGSVMAAREELGEARVGTAAGAFSARKWHATTVCSL